MSLYIVYIKDGIAGIYDSEQKAREMIDNQTDWDIDNIGEADDYEIKVIDMNVNFIMLTGPIVL
jgi:hypothetical protein